ncbi:serine/threonine-protein kinase haspin [Notolabrus celidotus]|uniref:serine/threonine-protein kinase haspin n=1 Tax=Notolabrus celidotus TaxID=1203425 RepID=UPI00148FCC66|nr:serine/threonine-protein kinase haspin [Notolabrus celidotus]
MKPLKPVYLKTYGKQTRKLSAWISPENRKQAFESTLSTDGDVSVFEPSRERMCSVAKRRVVRPPRKKAILCLTSGDEENMPSHSCPQPKNKTTRAKKTSVPRGRAARLAKAKAMACLTETSSDEENSYGPSPHGPKPAQQSKMTRKSRVTMKQTGQKVSLSNESEGSTTKCQVNSPQMKSDSNVCAPSASRFVTRRRRPVTAKPKVPLATSSILNSSDDFASRAFGSCMISQSSRRKSRRRIPPAFLVSSAENSMNATGTVSFATVPFREISLNESADRSLGPGSRRPIFCSTPSAGPLSKRQCLKPLTIIDQCSPSASVSVSCIDVMSAFQKELCSPGQPTPPQCSAPPIGLHSKAKLHSSLGAPEPSSDLFMEPTVSGSREESKSSSEDTNIKNDRELLQSLNLLSTDGSELSSCFVSAAGGLEWLIEALKEHCLTDRCTVQLERLDLLTMTQLCSQTTYSSCLEQSSSVHRTNEHPPSEHSLQTSCDHASNETRDYLHSAESFESPEHAAPVTESHSTNSSSLADCMPSVENSSSKEDSTEQPASNQHTDSSVEFIMGTQLLPNSPVQTLFSEEEAAAVKDKCPTKKCTVVLQKSALSPVIVQQLKELMQPQDAHLAFDEKSSKTDANTSENYPEGVTCSEEVTETMMASVMQSGNSSSTEAQIKSNDTEREERAAVYKALLKEKCLTDIVTVQMKRLTLTQLKEIRKLKGTILKSAADVSGSASDDQTKTEQQSESDINHSNEDTSAMRVRKNDSNTSEDRIVSDREEAAPHKRKKASHAAKEKKRRSTSADRPGTTRKACVSGLSVSRWKSKDSTHMCRSSKAIDCSINELISTQPKQPKELMGTMNFSTPARANRHNLSSLLADLTPNTQTWSRLKAALSVHRRGMVLLTPRSLRLSMSSTPGRTELADVSQDLFATPFRTPRSKRPQPQLLSCSSLAVREEEDLPDAEKVYAECGQSRPLPWEECILPQRMKKCVKIGEGTFGEVFSTTNSAGDTVALKIIPLEGSEKVNGEDQKTFGEILHEIIISKELSSLKEKRQNQTHGFIGLNNLHCVQGCYPPDFLKAWDTFDQKKGSENDRPDFFETDQLFIILEFEFGGSDLENSNGTLASLVVAKSILHQVTAALAVAEQELNFEHRDLHWGNVLVKTTKQKAGSFLLNGTVHSLETRGVLVRIIDYSLSRLEIDDLTVSCDISNDEELFMGQGDYQFDIYRLMRQENGNDWSTYHPHTNVLWLHYLCSKLLSLKYRGSGGRGAKDTREELNRFYDNVLQYSSATEALQKCPMFQ